MNGEIIDTAKAIAIFKGFTRFSYNSIEVLEFLKGRKLDEIALGWMWALKPSTIRVCTTGCTMDAVTDRITIWVDGLGVIKEIKQEVRVALPEGVEHGGHLSAITKAEKESQEFIKKVTAPLKSAAILNRGD